MKVLALVLGALTLVSLYCEASGQITFVPSNVYTVTETDGFSGVEITVRYDNAPPVSALLYTTVPGTATDGDDFLGTSSVVDFADTNQITFDVFIRGDDIFEPTENFTIELTRLSTNEVVATATVVIEDDEVPPPTIVWEQSKYSFTEDAGTVMICALPDPNAGPLTEDITVTEVEITDGSAMSPEDYAANIPSTWTFTPGPAESRQCIELFIIQTVQFETIETFTASFNQELPGGAVVNRETTICITDIDPVINIEWEEDPYVFEEGQSTFVEICAATSDNFVQDRVEIRQVVFRNGSALAGEDFIVPNADDLVLEFRDGQERQCVPFELVNDEEREETENLYVDLVSEFPEIETQTTEILIEDDDGRIVLEVEQEVYTVVEGNTLEVCVVVIRPAVTFAAFHVIGHIRTPRYSHYIRIYFAVGVSRSCGSIFIPGNTYVDQLERERLILFEVDQDFTNATLIEFIEFERFYAQIFIADDDIVTVALQQDTYQVDEGDVATVCVILLAGSLNRPVDILLYTDDGTALAGTNYERTVVIATLFALGFPGDTACVDIPTIDDGVDTGVLDFTVTISIADTHVIILDNDATVEIGPNFDICFNMDTPRVNGSELFLSFYSSLTVDSATCSVDSLPDQDCTSGMATFTFTDVDRIAPYLITITAQSGSQTATIEGIVRSELVDRVCNTHFINKGIEINGTVATINVQATGPSQDGRITLLQCRCLGAADESFSQCDPGGDVGGVALFDYDIPDGCTSIDVRQIRRNAGLTCRRGVDRILSFSFEEE